jgi:hypothetical protein
MRNPLFWGTSFAIAITCGAILYGNKYHNFDLMLWLSVVGTVITAIAFGFGTYFVTLAVEAYSQLNVVRQTSETVQKAALEVFAAEAALKDTRGEMQRVSKRMEDEAFRHLESLMTAIVEYVQHMPRGTGAQSKAAKHLINSAACVRARFICSISNDADAVDSALLILANFKDKSAVPILVEAKTRFRDNKDVCTALDYSVKMIGLP